MKIVAQAQVPSKTPFIHLGYLAVTTTTPHGLYMSGGIVFVLVALLAFFASSVALLKRSGKSTALFGAGFLLACVLTAGGGVLIVRAYQLGETHYAHPYRMSHHHADCTLRILDENFLKEGRAQPVDEDRLRRSVFNSIGSEGRDGWFNDFRIEVTRGEKRDTFLVISAGPDKMFGTPDDIRYWKAEDGEVKKKSEVRS